MKGLKDEFTGTGYNQEELYFHKLNRELVEKMKQKGLKVLEGGKAAAPQQQQAHSTPTAQKAHARGGGGKNKRAA